MDEFWDVKPAARQDESWFCLDTGRFIFMNWYSIETQIKKFVVKNISKLIYQTNLNRITRIVYLWKSSQNCIFSKSTYNEIEFTVLWVIRSVGYPLHMIGNWSQQHQPMLIFTVTWTVS